MPPPADRSPNSARRRAGAAAAARKPAARRAGRRAKSAVVGDAGSREQLLDAAGALMSERNSIDVSLSEVAAHSGLNSALVKYYFGNKEGLLLALVERDASAALHNLEQLLSLDLPPTEKLRRHIAGVINNFFRTPYLNRLLHTLLDARQSESRSAREIVRFFVKPLVALQGQLLEQGIGSGAFRRIDPMLFYVSMLGACDHLFNARYALRSVFGVGRIDEELREAYVGHVADVFINGICNPGSGNPDAPARSPRAALKTTDRPTARSQRALS